MKIGDVKTIGVMGMGVMGAGISQTAIQAGYNVVVRDLKDEILARGRENIISGRFGLKGGVERGKITKEQMEAAISRLKTTTRVEDLANVDILIEAIGGGPSGEMENKDLKLKVFAEIDGILKASTVIASNTSRFTIADLAAPTKRKDKFIGMHFFSPANIMRVVEVIWTKDTSEETIQCIEGLCDKMGKTHVRVKDIPGDTGFVGNRLFGVVGREARKIVEEGICTPEGVDSIMMGGFNWPAGPLGMGMGARAGWGQKK
jgi:3-hydroxybutyryl-CoA dehydrogenase